MKKFLPLALVMSLCSVSVFAGPHLDASRGTISSLGYNIGSSSSSSQTVVIESTMMALSSGTITATAPADYEISLDNTTFSSTASIPYSNDMLAATNVYIHLKTGLLAGEYNNEQLQFVTTGVSATVTLNGIITSPCTVANGTITGTTASFMWNATGAASYEVKVDQAAVSPTTTGTAATTNNYTASGLTQNTNYYFHVRGKGTNGNYTSWANQPFSTVATSISTTPNNDFDAHLVPNPNYGAFTISGALPGAKQVSVMVVNATGQNVYSAVIAVANGVFKQSIKLADSIPAGMYFLRLSTNDHKSSITRFAIAQ